MAKRGKGKFNVSSYATISSNYKVDTLCSPMLERLKIAPYAVALDATPLQSYKSGILTPTTNYTSINHGVTLVGNDADGNWIVQNSWGTGWG
jgi:C1A family cysteine protease